MGQRDGFRSSMGSSRRVRLAGEPPTRLLQTRQTRWMSSMGCRSQVFNADRSTGMRSGQSVRKAVRHGNQKREETEAPPLSNVDIINGARWETRTFEGAEDEPPLPERERRRLQHVVVGIESAESEKRLGNTTRV